MEFPQSRIILLILLGAASLVCFVTGVSWILATRQMYKSGKARSLLLPLPAFMFLDIMNVSRKFLRSRLPPDLESRLDRMQFESTLSANYVKAFALLVLSFVAAGMVYHGLHPY